MQEIIIHQKEIQAVQHQMVVEVEEQELQVLLDHKVLVVMGQFHLLTVPHMLEEEVQVDLDQLGVELVVEVEVDLQLEEMVQQEQLTQVVVEEVIDIIQGVLEVQEHQAVQVSLS
jgi:hypothetical protein